MAKSVMRWEWETRPYSYEISDDDYLNLARAVQFEGKPQNAILWTLLQRFAMLYALGTYKNLSDFVKAYVQPINPKWFPDGVLHKAYLKTLKDAGKKAEADAEIRNAQLRVNKAKYPLSNLTVTSISTVDNVLSGGITKSPSPESIHYWASRASSGMTQPQAKEANQKAKPGLTILDVGAGWLPGVNVFFTSPQAKNIHNLRFEKPGTKTTSGIVKGLVGMSIFALVSYQLWRTYGG